MTNQDKTIRIDFKNGSYYEYIRSITIHFKDNGEIDYISSIFNMEEMNKRGLLKYHYIDTSEIKLITSYPI